MDFISKYLKYHIVLKPMRTKTSGNGDRYIEDGISVTFSEGRFNTVDPEVIELLKKNPRFGLDFMSPEVETGVLTPEAQQSQINEKAALENINLSCPTCKFKAKSAFGLQSHMRAHERKGS